MNINNNKISIIIPCKNEFKFIRTCLDSILANNYPKDKIEILVIDGMSNDGTREIVSEEYVSGYNFIRLLDNPLKITPCALNIGIKHAKGDIIFILSAHCSIEKNYIVKCEEKLQESKADNVGGVLRTVAWSRTTIARAIACALRTRVGVGNSLFRVGTNAPQKVATVPFGCYRRSVFDKIGLFNTALVRTQDNEFNCRLIDSGGIIMLYPDVVTDYFAPPTFMALARKMFATGYWVIYSKHFIKRIYSIRQLMPLALVVILIITGFTIPKLAVAILAFYGIVVCAASIWYAGRTIILIPFLIISYTVIHFLYGIGSLCGFIYLLKNIK